MKASFLVVAFLLMVVGANIAITQFGVVPIGFGLMAPAGVYFAGVSFTLRDALQETGGRKWVIGAILIGAALSAVLSSRLALASGTAFMLSEAADFAVYTPLRRRGWLLAVAASNAAGLVIDSALFLWLAFGSLDYLTGQVIGKAYMTVAAIIVIATWRWRGVLLRRTSSRMAQ